MAIHSDDPIDPAALGSVAWHALHHAYGPADDVPVDLQDLASSDAEVREEARWNLSSTIYHQGDVFDATAAAVPFLLDLAVSKVAGRECILELVQAIAESAGIEPASTRTLWAKQIERYPSLFGPADLEKAERQIAWRALVWDALCREAPRLRSLQGDANMAMAAAATAVIKVLASSRPA